MNPQQRGEAAVGVGVLAVAGVLAAGAAQIRGDAGYGGVGPAFLPWLVAAALALAGIALLRSALAGGWRGVEAPADTPRWAPVAWISAGLLLNAALITRIGFVLSCTLLFVLAARGFRVAMDERAASPARWLRDAAVGLALSAPVYWLFTKGLGLTLPGLTATGWI